MVRNFLRSVQSVQAKFLAFFSLVVGGHPSYGLIYLFCLLILQSTLHAGLVEST